MKKRLIIAIVLALVLSLTLVASASAKMKNKAKPLVCRADMAISLAGDPPYVWSGDIYGDVNGTLEFGELPSYEGPFLYTFTEWFKITNDLGEIKGYDMGIWYESGQFRACGWVTDATGPYESLIGWLVYEDGVTVWDDTVPGYTVDGLYIGFMPPLPAQWASVWR